MKESPKEQHLLEIDADKCMGSYWDLTFETAEILMRPHVTSLSVSGGLVLLWVRSSAFFLPCQCDHIHSLPGSRKHTLTCSQYSCCVFQYTYMDYYFQRSWLSVYRLRLPIIVQSPACCPPTPAKPTNQPLSVCCQETTNPLQVWQQSPDALDTLTAIRAVTNKWLVNTLLEVFICNEL